MRAYLRFTVTALCATLLGLPAALAQDPSATRIRIEIGLNEGEFAAFPDTVTLKAGESYRLELVNWNRDVRHVVLGPELAAAVRTVSVRKFPEREEMTSAGFGGGIEIPPGRRVEVYFVPGKAGRYRLFCQDQVHTQAGMDVMVEVQL